MQNTVLDLGIPGEGKPRIGEVFYVKRAGSAPGFDSLHRFRVSGFYKTFTPPPCSCSLIEEILQDLEKEKTPEQRAYEACQIKLIACSREEAEFVGGSGVCGIVRRVEDVEVIGLVSWTPERIIEERAAYNASLSSPHRELPFALSRYWEKR